MSASLTAIVLYLLNWFVLCLALSLLPIVFAALFKANRVNEILAAGEFYIVAATLWAGRIGFSGHRCCQRATAHKSHSTVYRNSCLGEGGVLG
jgi:hypothetical protein